jgi:hypothetical protein
MELTEHHRAILVAIGVDGTPLSGLRNNRAREFDDLRHAGLIVFWPSNTPQPVGAFGCLRSGSWCLTQAGVLAAGLNPGLRLADEP